ncbi:MAG: PQQ-binding-like beta-propeller repeat protein [Bacteroidia bacterium]|nr:PQQ-binding-like beta-propeller repeat protein [Bacteroidia bacterium]
MQNCILLYLFFLSIITSSCRFDPQKNVTALFAKKEPVKTPVTLISKKKIIPGDTSRIKVFNGTFLGNEKRNFYGLKAPTKLKEVWRFPLGTGNTRIGSQVRTWGGSGWTGQPLILLEDSIPYLIQGAYDHHLRKINALTGEEIWKYKFDDVVKATGTVRINLKAKSYDEKYVILQGSRQGFAKSFSDPFMPSLRAVSYITGKELWRMNSRQTECYSRDVDGSAFIRNDTAYICLENGIFTVFDPDKNDAVIKNNITQPRIYEEHMLYKKKDKATHGSDLVAESSPSLLGNRIYITAGSGHIYGYNLKTRTMDWDFVTGSDLNGSPVVTKDSCLLITVEKQFIRGRGGVLKMDPSRPPEQSVVWYFPTEDKKYSEWMGGVIGSLSINDYYNPADSFPNISAFIGIDGYLYVVDYKTIIADKKVLGFDNKTYYNTPKLLFKQEIGPSISTPVIVDNKLIAASYKGLYLFEFDKNMKFKQLDYKVTSSIEATPVVYNHRVFVASRDGNLYCFGDDTIRRGKKTLLASKDKFPVSKENVTTQKLVTEKKTTREEVVKKQKISQATKGSFQLIAGSFTIKSNAEKFVLQLTKEGYKPQIIVASGNRNLVSIGAFTDKNEAAKEQEKLRAKGKDSWILDYK